MRAVLSLVLILGLAACTGTFSNPGAMPSGYKHHGTTYNARPGPEVSTIKKARFDALQSKMEEKSCSSCDKMDCDKGYEGICEKSVTKDCAGTCEKSLDKNCGSDCMTDCDTGTCNKKATSEYTSELTPDAPQNILVRQ